MRGKVKNNNNNNNQRDTCKNLKRNVRFISEKQNFYFPTFLSLYYINKFSKIPEDIAFGKNEYSEDSKTLSENSKDYSESFCVKRGRDFTCHLFNSYSFASFNQSYVKGCGGIQT